MKKVHSVFAVIFFFLSFSIHAQSKYDGNAEGKNYSIIPKLPAPPKPEPFTVTTIPLPANVIESDLINYLPDGKHIIMEIHTAGKKKSDLAVMNEDGSGFKCLTCDLKEEIGGEMTVPLPDGKRVYTPTGILECTPSIVNCKEAKILPLLYPEIPNAKIVMRIATNMSPNGIHVASGLVTSRGYLVVVSELTRVSDEKGERYELQNAKVIASSSQQADFASFRPKNDGGGEVKSFAEGGRYLINLSVFESSNFDLAKIDLVTGEVSRLTKHFSYDEGTYPSPDGDWVIFQTHRHTTRMDAFGLVPRPLIAGMPQVAGVAYQRNAEFEENIYKPRRFYGLTMVDKYGDRARLPEEGYTGLNLMTAKDNVTLYNHLGNFAWHPSSTRGIFWEQKDPKTVSEGELTGRLRMLKFTSRKPTKPLAFVKPEMKWATNLKDFKWLTTTYPEQGILKGKVSGYAEISTSKPEQGSKIASRRIIKYVDFTDDGIYILNGTESSTIGEAYDKPVSWDADIKVTGKRTGFLKAQDVQFYINKMSSGTIETQLGVHKITVNLAKGLPTGVPGELR